MFSLATRHSAAAAFRRAPLFNTVSALNWRLLSTETKSRIEKAINSAPVCLFMKGTQEQPMCGFSRAAVQVLEVQGVQSFASVNVLEDPEIREGIKEFSEWPTIPQLYVKGQFVGGADIMIDMYKNGELEDLLVKEGVIAPAPADETTKA
ncbi:thioredoxin-like protein [Catenaria anguillulae PL171]|uniref:Monothiol glutaredoxin-5, mitochondrial n=1 Tax=Catenaria anguillulae PL171 TaxID=765915 RepID=A0A1Y2HUC9_9FUNG|nr:thioredoxin-like protein [Catenaria anguillulae PL171]